MKKHYVVPQPPLTDYFTLLVDDLNETETFGYTTEIEKCEYNRDVMEAMGMELNFKVQMQTALAEKGITIVTPLGRFIVIIKISRDETKQEMFFFDGFSKVNFREQNAITKNFSENIVDKFEASQVNLKSFFTDEHDIIELLVPEE